MGIFGRKKRIESDDVDTDAAELDTEALDAESEEDRDAEGDAAPVRGGASRLTDPEESVLEQDSDGPDDDAVIAEGPEATEATEDTVATEDTDGAESDDESEDQSGDQESAEWERIPRPHEVDRSTGPFDVSELEDDDEAERLDLGALQVTPVPGSELRLDVDAEGTQVTGVTAVLGDSAVQVQAFAAPKRGGLWDTIRDEIADNLIEAGGTATESLGDLGIELQARMPTRGDDGRTTYSPVRFLGVDGPRWFLRGVLSGRAAVEDEAAQPLVDFMRQVVVVRGSEARAPRELLELTIPREVSDAANGQAAEEDSAQDDLKPFERGPEITEVR
ncbi:DUF3710 domain-containing protein [Dermacoccaceae bacterium W4C1]